MVQRRICSCWTRVPGAKVELVHELVDLRLIHLVRSRITVSKRPGQIFEGYMLDVSQYTGSRKRHNFELVNFWIPEKIEELRRVKLIYEPGQGHQSSPSADVPA